MWSNIVNYLFKLSTYNTYPMNKVCKKIHFQSIWYIAVSLCKIEKGSNQHVNVFFIMNINQKFKNRRPKSVFRQKSPDQCSCFEIYGDTLWSRHRPLCYNSPIQSWASSLSKRRLRFPSDIDFILIKKLTKNQIRPPVFPNGGRGSLLFLKLTSF